MVSLRVGTDSITMPVTLKFVVRSASALLGIGFSALLIVVASSMWLGERAQHHLSEVAALRDLHNTATLVREGLLIAESSQRGYVLTGNEIYLAPYDSAKTLALSQLQKLEAALAARPDRQTLLSALSGVITRKLTEQDRTIALRASGREEDAVAEIKANHGKALMDEANVYLSAVALESDEDLTSAVGQQTSNTRWLKWTTTISALVIVLVVSGVIVTLHRYTREIMSARDEVKKVNDTLEHRVKQRTHELAQARDRAELLLAEVNHRVSNSLALVSSLVRMQARELNEPAAKAALVETMSRIQAIAEMHRHLFTTGNIGKVAADSYLSAVLAQVETAVATSGSPVRLKRDLAHVILPTTDAVNLGIVVTEWVTNACKYAYPDGAGEVRVTLGTNADEVTVSVEDDGVGVSPGVKGTGLGTRVVTTIAGLMQGNTHYGQRNPGTVPAFPSRSELKRPQPRYDGDVARDHTAAASSNCARCFALGRANFGGWRHNTYRSYSV